MTDKQEKALIEIEKCHGYVMSIFNTSPLFLDFRKVDEFQNYADMDAMLQYCKDVQMIQRRLTEIQEQVHQINKVNDATLATTVYC